MVSLFRSGPDRQNAKSDSVLLTRVLTRLVMIEFHMAKTLDENHTSLDNNGFTKISAVPSRIFALEDRCDQHARATRRLDANACKRHNADIAACTRVLDLPEAANPLAADLATDAPMYTET